MFKTNETKTILATLSLFLAPFACDVEDDDGPTSERTEAVASAEQTRENARPQRQGLERIHDVSVEVDASAQRVLLADQDGNLLDLSREHVTLYGPEGSVIALSSEVESSSPAAAATLPHVDDLAMEVDSQEWWQCFNCNMNTFVCEYCVYYPPPSCLGNCGGFAGGCWCDSLCSYYGDCCADKYAYCG